MAFYDLRSFGVQNRGDGRSKSPDFCRSELNVPSLTVVQCTCYNVTSCLVHICCPSIFDQSGQNLERSRAFELGSNNIKVGQNQFILTYNMNIPKLNGNSMETFFLEVSLLNLNFPLLLNRIPSFPRIDSNVQILLFISTEFFQHI